MAPIYCHFLDRELCSLAGYRQTGRKSAKALAIASLFAEPFAYASLSGVHEASGIGRLHQKVLPFLVEHYLFASVSDARSAEEFLASRRRLYAHDRRRYPFYFGVEERSKSLFVPSEVKATATTDALQESLLSVIQLDAHSAVRHEAHDVAALRLNQREQEAITYAMFRRQGPRSDHVREIDYAIRRAISIAYTTHHLMLYPDAAILPGIPLLGQFDAVFMKGNRQSVPTFVVALDLLAWAEPTVLDQFADARFRAWRELVEFSLSEDGAQFRHGITAWKRFQVERGTAGLVRERRQLRYVISKLSRTDRWQTNLLRAVEGLRPAGLKEEEMKSTILVYCVNDNERRGIVAACNELGIAPGLSPHGRYIAAESLGTYNGLDYILVRSGAGSVGQDASQGVILDALADFSPRLVASVGIAFGMKVQADVREPLVLIASVVKGYERVRLGRSESGDIAVRDRGEVGNPDPIRLGKLRVAADRMGGKAAIGQVVSGEKLVDEPGFLRELKDRYPDALGGEMEGIGVAAACARRNVPWLLLKAVSDDGDGTKERNADEDEVQMRGARAAMRLLLFAGSQGYL